MKKYKYRICVKSNNNINSTRKLYKAQVLKNFLGFEIWCNLYKYHEFCDSMTKEKWFDNTDIPILLIEEHKSINKNNCWHDGAKITCDIYE